MHSWRLILVETGQKDGIARCVEVDAGTPRRSWCATIDRIAVAVIAFANERRCTDHDRAVRVPWGDAACIDLEIAGGHDDGNSRGAKRGDRAIERWNARGGVSDERPIGDRGNAAMPFMILYCPLRPVDDTANRAAELLALNHFYVDDLGVGRDAERLPRDRAGDGGAVRVADGRIFGERRVAATNATGKLRVIQRDPAVEHIDRHAAAGARMTIGVIERQV